MVHMFNLAMEQMKGVQVAYDTHKKVIHLLEVDHDKSKTTSLCQWFGELQQHIVERVKQYGSPCSEVRWLLYDAQGAVKEFRNGEFNQVELNHPDLYTSFASKLKVRRLHIHS